jgi:aspartokinase
MVIGIRLGPEPDGRAVLEAEHEVVVPPGFAGGEPSGGLALLVRGSSPYSRASIAWASRSRLR